MFRDGPVKPGRNREFTQCDVDIVGVPSGVAEAELMMMALDAFKELDLNVTIQYNNRKLLTGLLMLFETPTNKINEVILTIDKLEKIGVNEVMDELYEKGITSKSLQSIQEFLTTGTINELQFFERYSNQNKELDQGLKELSELNRLLKYLEIDQKCVFNPFLARGLEIYTGTIYEIFLSDGSIKSSIGSGGRYDNAINGLRAVDDKIFPTVGISFGLDVMLAAMKLKNGNKVEEKTIDYYIVPINTQKESLKLAHDLRKQGFKVEVELSNKKLGRALDRANKENVPKVIIIGETEVQNNQYKVKDMLTGEERSIAFQY